MCVIKKERKNTYTTGNGGEGGIPDEGKRRWRRRKALKKIKTEALAE